MYSTNSTLKFSISDQLILNHHIIPLRIVLGDQQAALIGQEGYIPGSVAMNFGTSGSVQINAGKSISYVDGLISSGVVC
ncbi:MAG: hypothetical protein Ct9H300mP29_4350 [Candidatus Neomarinimicrobiota bacterium]|nr:MAG: hypothetical protein Ct9H300mP29_4350 [Candidatus Neomarinimicrobiota bacterium]